MKIIPVEVEHNICDKCIFEKMQYCPAEDNDCALGCEDYHIFVVEEE